MASEKRRRILDPTERFSEILFGLIMVLTFTGSLSVATSGREDVRTMLIGAVGCNLAWGIVDAIMYLLNTLAERGETSSRCAECTRPRQPQHARALSPRRCRPSSPRPCAPTSSTRSDSVSPRCRSPPSAQLLQRDDFLGALAVFLLVFLSTFPVVLPFLFIRETLTGAARLERDRPLHAPRTAATGWADSPVFARGGRALAMVGIGLVLVVMTIALGG